MSKGMISKQQIRREIEAQRRVLDAQWLKAASARVVANLQSLEVFQSSETIALYMAITGEVNLDSLFPKCRELGKCTCIPVFNAKTKLYEMAEITPETECFTGHYGIQEPLSPALFPMGNVDLVVVPGVAFDREGSRLGRGGGYYDRLLEGFSGASVAVAFDFQVLPKIPLEQHDKPVDILVTETETEIVNVLQ